MAVQVQSLVHSFVPMTGLGTTLEVESDGDNMLGRFERSNPRVDRDRRAGLDHESLDIHQCSHSGLEMES